MAAYLFQLDHLHIDFMRGKDGDAYVVTFGIEVGSRAIGPLGAFATGPGRNWKSGDDVNLSQFPPTNPAGNTATWSVGPVQVAAGDIVNVEYAFVNGASSQSGLTQGDIIKINFAAWSTLIGVGVATVTGGVAAVVGAAVAGLGSLLGELLGDVFPGTPNCNGLAFADKYALSASELAGGTNNVDGQMIITRTSENPDIPSDCGHPSVGEITVSITAVPLESTRKFLGPRGDLSRGIKKALNLTETTTLRHLIEQ